MTFPGCAPAQGAVRLPQRTPSSHTQPPQGSEPLLSLQTLRGGPFAAWQLQAGGHTGPWRSPRLGAGLSVDLDLQELGGGCVRQSGD